MEKAGKQNIKLLKSALLGNLPAAMQKDLMIIRQMFMKDTAMFTMEIWELLILRRLFQHNTPKDIPQIEILM